MSALRVVVRGDRKYYYLVHTYRWAGRVGRKEKYLGTTPPTDLHGPRADVEREVWEATWFPEFRAIHQAFRSRQRSLPKSILEKERENFIVEFTYDTNRIEGSTLTFQETSDLLTHGISPGARPMRDVRETLSHAALLRRLLTDPEPIDLPHLLSWHKAIFAETKPDIAGRVRDFEVRIAGSRHVPPVSLEVRALFVELLRRFRRHWAASNPVEAAATFHFQFEDIHPFGDGNGRIGRLAMNMALFHAQYPMINIRYGKRKGYYRALERASLSSSPRPFLQWFFHAYVAEQRWWLGRREIKPLA